MGLWRFSSLLPYRPSPFPRCRTSCAQVFLWSYLTLLLVTTVLFAVSLLDLHRQSAQLSPRLDNQDLQSSSHGVSPSPSVPACPLLSRLSTPSFLAAGWTKAVFRARMALRRHADSARMDVAVKVVNLHGRDYVACLRDAMLPPRVCYRRSAAKILKETALLTHLLHPNIIKVLGHCGPGSMWHFEEEEEDKEEENGRIGNHQEVILVTELGQPLDTIHLLQMPWEDRLRVAYDVAVLLDFMATSPLGSLAVNDLRRQQFVLVQGQLKLSDVDDVGVTEPLCQTHDDCVKGFSPLRHGNDDVLVKISCIRGECIGHNERKNVLSAGKQLVLPFLAMGTPEGLTSQVEEILDCYSWALCSASHIRVATQKLTQDFAAGSYRNYTHKSRVAQEFERIENSDLEGRFDYSCPKSLSSASCVRSVADDDEAKALCAQDRSCQAIVLGPSRTWTGRTLAFFKNGKANPSVHTSHTLLLRTS